jgi:hypothetical protein
MSEQGKPGPDFSGSGAVEYNPAGAQAQSPVEALLAREEPGLLSIPGVVSVGIAAGGPGGEHFVVGVTDAAVAARLPGQIGGVPLTISVTGEVDAQPLEWPPR